MKDYSDLTQRTSLFQSLSRPSFGSAASAPAPAQPAPEPASEDRRDYSDPTQRTNLFQNLSRPSYASASSAPPAPDDPRGRRGRANSNGGGWPLQGYSDLTRRVSAASPTLAAYSPPPLPPPPPPTRPQPLPPGVPVAQSAGRSRPPGVPVAPTSPSLNNAAPPLGVPVAAAAAPPPGVPLPPQPMPGRCPPPPPPPFPPPPPGVPIASSAASSPRPPPPPGVHLSPSFVAPPPPPPPPPLFDRAATSPPPLGASIYSPPAQPPPPPPRLMTTASATAPAAAATETAFGSQCDSGAASDMRKQRRRRWDAYPVVNNKTTQQQQLSDGDSGSPTKGGSGESLPPPAAAETVGKSDRLTEAVTTTADDKDKGVAEESAGVAKAVDDDGPRPLPASFMAGKQDRAMAAADGKGQRDQDEKGVIVESSSSSSHGGRGEAEGVGLSLRPSKASSKAAAATDAAASVAMMTSPQKMLDRWKSRQKVRRSSARDDRKKDEGSSSRPLSAAAKEASVEPRLNGEAATLMAKEGGRHVSPAGPGPTSGDVLLAHVPKKKTGRLPPPSCGPGTSRDVTKGDAGAAVRKDIHTAKKAADGRETKKAATTMTAANDLGVSDGQSSRPYSRSRPQDDFKGEIDSSSTAAKDGKRRPHRSSQAPDLPEGWTVVDLPAGWKHEAVPRKKDPATKDNYWWNPEGKRFRSRPEVERFLQKEGRRSPQKSTVAAASSLRRSSSSSVEKTTPSVNRKKPAVYDADEKDRTGRRTKGTKSSVANAKESMVGMARIKGGTATDDSRRHVALEMDGAHLSAEAALEAARERSLARNMRPSNSQVDSGTGSRSTMTVPPSSLVAESEDSDSDANMSISTTSSEEKPIRSSLAEAETTSGKMSMKENTIFHSLEEARKALLLKRGGGPMQPNEDSADENDTGEEPLLGTSRTEIKAESSEKGKRPDVHDVGLAESVRIRSSEQAENDGPSDAGLSPPEGALNAMTSSPAMGFAKTKGSKAREEDGGKKTLRADGGSRLKASSPTAERVATDTEAGERAAPAVDTESSRNRTAVTPGFLKHRNRNSSRDIPASRQETATKSSQPLATSAPAGVCVGELEIGVSSGSSTHDSKQSMDQTVGPTKSPSPLPADTVRAVPSKPVAGDQSLETDHTGMHATAEPQHDEIKTVDPAVEASRAECDDVAAVSGDHTKFPPADHVSNSDTMNQKRKEAPEDGKVPPLAKALGGNSVDNNTAVSKGGLVSKTIPAEEVATGRTGDGADKELDLSGGEVKGFTSTVAASDSQTLSIISPHEDDRQAHSSQQSQEQMLAHSVINSGQASKSEVGRTHMQPAGERETMPSPNSDDEPISQRRNKRNLRKRVASSVECPICHAWFDHASIESHANMCAERFSSSSNKSSHSAKRHFKHNQSLSRKKKRIKRQQKRKHSEDDDAMDLPLASLRRSTSPSGGAPLEHHSGDNEADLTLASLRTKTPINDCDDLPMASLRTAATSVATSSAPLDQRSDSDGDDSTKAIRKEDNDRIQKHGLFARKAVRRKKKARVSEASWSDANDSLRVGNHVMQSQQLPPGPVHPEEETALSTSAAQRQSKLDRLARKKRKRMAKDAAGVTATLVGGEGRDDSLQSPLHEIRSRALTADLEIQSSFPTSMYPLYKTWSDNGDHGDKNDAHTEDRVTIPVTTKPYASVHDARDFLEMLQACAAEASAASSGDPPTNVVFQFLSIIKSARMHHISAYQLMQRIRDLIMSVVSSCENGDIKGQELMAAFQSFLPSSYGMSNIMSHGASKRVSDATSAQHDHPESFDAEDSIAPLTEQNCKAARTDLAFNWTEERRKILQLVETEVSSTGLVSSEAHLADSESAEAVKKKSGNLSHGSVIANSGGKGFSSKVSAGVNSSKRLATASDMKGGTPLVSSKDNILHQSSAHSNSDVGGTDNDKHALRASVNDGSCAAGNASMDATHSTSTIPTPKAPSLSSTGLDCDGAIMSGKAGSAASQVSGSLPGTPSTAPISQIPASAVAGLKNMGKQDNDLSLNNGPPLCESRVHPSIQMASRTGANVFEIGHGGSVGDTTSKSSVALNLAVARGNEANTAGVEKSGIATTALTTLQDPGQSKNGITTKNAETRRAGALASDREKEEARELVPTQNYTGLTKPKKPTNAFTHFCRVTKPIIRAELNQMPLYARVSEHDLLPKINAEAKIRWKSLGNDEKAFYVQESIEDKERFDAEMKIYKQVQGGR